MALSAGGYMEGLGVQGYLGYWRVSLYWRNMDSLLGVRGVWSLQEVLWEDMDGEHVNDNVVVMKKVAVVVVVVFYYSDMGETVTWCHISLEKSAQMTPPVWSCVVKGVDVDVVVDASEDDHAVWPE